MVFRVSSSSHSKLCPCLSLAQHLFLFRADVYERGRFDSKFELAVSGEPGTSRHEHVHRLSILRVPSRENTSPSPSCRFHVRDTRHQRVHSCVAVSTRRDTNVLSAVGVCSSSSTLFQSCLRENVSCSLSVHVLTHLCRRSQLPSLC